MVRILRWHCGYLAILFCNSYISVGSSECECPDECRIVTYSSTLSSSDLSEFKTDEMTELSNNFQHSYRTAIETANRVDDLTYLDTISRLENMLNSHTELTRILSSKFVQEQTSVTNSILKALSKIVAIIKTELTIGGGKFLSVYWDCYKTNIDYIVGGLYGKLTSCDQTLAQIQTISFTYPNLTDLEYDFLRSSSRDINLFKTLLKKVTQHFEWNRETALS